MKNKTKNNTIKIALCGVLSALSIVILHLGFMIAIGTFAGPALASICLLPIVFEYGEKTGFTMYLAVSALAFFTIPDYELSFMYIFVFGLYTVFKIKIDKIQHKSIKNILKFIFINLSIVLSYSILLFIFPVSALVNEFAQTSTVLIILMIVILNITFFLFDIALEKILIIYVIKYRKRIFK